ncbi:transposase domain-containing protein [Tepidimonas taiwanensis]|uniref:transposase domain-containing protein n=1 Tax=Tepidimonas taiwanensis TaxID=307486 RepID=UPI00068E5F77|nr:transposase domain-containing protein [Tepidimonas taiwanensis]
MPQGYLMGGPATAGADAGNGPLTRGAGSIPAASTIQFTEALWAAFGRRPQRVQEEAKRRFSILIEARRLMEAGVPVKAALAQAAKAAGESAQTVVGWYYGRGKKPGVVGQPVGDWVPLLAPDWGVQCQREARFSDAAWFWALNQYLRPEAPSAARVYRDLVAVAPSQGWVVPSYATFERRLKQLPWQRVVLAREGEEALKARLPALQRSVRHLQALSFVNADGHRFDVFVRLPERFGGGVGRPCLIAWQDVYSRKLLAWRLTPTLNAYSVQLSFADLVEAYGVPDEAVMDNGREFGAEAMTGGVPWRFRFRLKADREEERPLGMLPMLGVKVHFTTPFHGQSKPIERAFRDLCEEIAKDPRCAGAYTGNRPDAKPENYGAKAIEWDEFERIVAEGIARHNAREGRRTETAKGRSFDAVFAESYAKRVVKKLAPSQRALLLLAVAGVTVRQDGCVELLGNRYGHPDLGAFRGERVVVRFDPDRLDRPVRVERLDGVHVVDAEPMWAPFDNQLVAQAHGRGQRRLAKLHREQLKVIRKLGSIEARLPAVEVPVLPSPAAVELVRAAQEAARPAVDAACAERYSRLAEAAILDLGRRMAG